MKLEDSLRVQKKEKSIDHEEAKALARDKDPSVRMGLARREDIEPELLYFLAEDPDADVRRAVAENTASPRQADLILARDDDHAVRSCLAEKISILAPNLSPTEQQRIHAMTTEVLEVLAEDQLVRVRQVLSEALKDVAHAPPAVIKQLALDTELVVAGPVLEFSPVLSDADLVEIIKQSPAEGGLGAISRREGVSEVVSDAIVSTEDRIAIGDLLGNRSAQIREETLDDLVERGAGIKLWHAPLSARPGLPPRAVAKLAHYVADNLLEVLQSRNDLDPETLKAVKSVVHERLSADPEKGVDGEDTHSHRPGLAVETPYTMAKRLHENKRLDESIISNALNAGDGPFVYAALSVLSDMPAKAVEKIFSEKSPKGIVALVWRSGLSVRFAEQAQLRLGSVSPAETLKATVGGNYPLNKDEMIWQLDFFKDLATRGGA